MREAKRVDTFYIVTPEDLSDFGIREIEPIIERFLTVRTTSLTDPQWANFYSLVHADPVDFKNSNQALGCAILKGMEDPPVDPDKVMTEFGISKQELEQWLTANNPVFSIRDAVHELAQGIRV